MIALLLTLTMALAGALPAAGQIVFVDDDAAAGGDGTSWATAFDDLQAALAAARTVPGAIDEIRVGQGTYRPDRGTFVRSASFELVDEVTIRGGFAGTGTADPDERDIARFETVLTGDLRDDDVVGGNRNDNSFHVITAMDVGDGAIVEGFTVTAGNADGFSFSGSGGALMVLFAEPAFVNCVFTDHDAVSSGAVAWLWYADISFADSRFHDNRTTGTGGVLRVTEGIVQLDKCVFENNTADFDGGVIDANNASLTVTGSTFRANTSISRSGGAMELEDCIAAIVDTEFDTNSSDGPVICSVGFGYGDRLHLERCMFTDNVGSSAVYANQTPLTALDSMFARNEGVALRAFATDVTVDSCVFTENETRFDGAGIYVADCSVALTGCDFIDNTAFEEGGGVFCLGGTLTVEDCDFTGNFAIDRGGAMSVGRSSNQDLVVDIRRSNFVGNSSSTGGALALRDQTTTTIDDCVFEGNVANTSGGAITTINGASELICTNSLFVDNSGTFTAGGAFNGFSSAAEFRDCRFESNRSETGGGMSLYDVSGSIIDCTFLGNECYDVGAGGGGIYMRACNDLSIINTTLIDNRTSQNCQDGGGGIAINESSPLLAGCLINGNSFQSSYQFAYGGGGVLIENGSTPLLVACTITGNDTNRDGGGVHVRASDPTLAGCILWDNTHSGTAGQAAQIHIDESSTAVIDYSCIEDLDGSLGGVGNIAANPLFVDAAGPDGQAGTEDDDLRLSSGSPCIDAGDNTAVPEDVTTDVAGLPRFVDDPDTADTGNGAVPIVDIGAHEFQVSCAADVDGNGEVGFGDVLAILAAWGPCPPVCPADVDGNGDVGFGDVLVVLAAWGACP